MSETPECLGSKYLKIEKTLSGELIGPCLTCRKWRECLAKRTEG